MSIKAGDDGVRMSYENLRFPRRKCVDPEGEERQKRLALYYEEGMRLRGFSGIYKLICSHCGKPVYSKSPRALYCGYRCRNDARIARKARRRELKRLKRCRTCNKNFQANRKDTVYCSVACKQKAYRERNVTNIGLPEIRQT